MRMFGLGGARVVALSQPRLLHGSVKHMLEWTTSLHQLSYDPLLITFAEGLVETVHPYYFVARAGFQDLLEAPGAAKKAVPMLKRLVVPLRAALVRPPVVHMHGMVRPPAATANKWHDTATCCANTRYDKATRCAHVPRCLYSCVMGARHYAHGCVRWLPGPLFRPPSSSKLSSAGWTRSLC